MKQTLARLLALCLLSLNMHAQAEPASKIQASYDVVGFGMTLAKITETFTRTQDSYQIDSVTKAVGMLARFKPETVRVSSHGKITAQGLIPLAYSMTREIDTGKNASALFNWETATLTHKDYKGINDMPLPKGTQDRISVLYQLSLLAKTTQDTQNFSITDGNNLQAYSFHYSTKEREISVPLGSYKSRNVSNTPVADGVQYEIWMASELDNYPCKIIVTDSSGGKLTQVLTGLTITP